MADPPVKAVRTSHSGPDIPVFDYGNQRRLRYPDFIPQSGNSNFLDPPRTSMLDDLCFYIQTHGTRLQIDGPELVYALSAKIIASHYTLLAEFIENIFLNTNFKMSRQANLSRFDTFVVESQWSDVHAYYILVWRFLSRLESIMLQLRVPFGEPDTSQHPAWTDIRVDFNTLHMKFRRLQQGVELLNASITGLASIAGNRQALTEQKLSLAATERSIREARSAKALTFVGLVFIPLAYMASLFSMSDPYGPGGGGILVILRDISTPSRRRGLFLLCLGPWIRPRGEELVVRELHHGSEGNCAPIPAICIGKGRRRQVIKRVVPFGASFRCAQGSSAKGKGFRQLRRAVDTPRSSEIENDGPR